MSITVKAPATAKLIIARGTEMREFPDHSITIARKYDVDAGLNRLIHKAFEKNPQIQIAPLMSNTLEDFKENGVRYEKAYT